MAKKDIVQSGEKLDIYYDPKNDNHTIEIKYPLYQTNFLTESRQLLSKSVYRAVKFIVKRVQEDRVNLPTYINNKETLHVKIPREDILRWYPDEHAHRELKEAAKWLNNTSVNYETPTGWTIAKLIGEVSYDKDKGLDLYLTPGVLPLYHVVENNFTLLDFTATMAIQNKPATFFYDKCCKWRQYGLFSYTPEELATALNVNLPTALLRKRYILPAEEELKNLYKESVVDVYFDCYEVRGGVGQGGTINRWVFRVRKFVPGSSGEMMDISANRNKCVDIIKSTVPTMISDNIVRQIWTLSQDEVFDLRQDLRRFKRDVENGKIRNARDRLWFLLRNRYNINLNGDTRLKTNKQCDYPKYKKIGTAYKVEDVVLRPQNSPAQTSLDFAKPEWWKYWAETINWIINNHTYDGKPLDDKDKDTFLYMFNQEDKFYPDYDIKSNTLNLRVDFNIYTNFLVGKIPPYEGLSSTLIQAVKVTFMDKVNFNILIVESGKPTKKMFQVLLNGEKNC